MKERISIRYATEEARRLGTKGSIISPARAQNREKGEGQPPVDRQRRERQTILIRIAAVYYPGSNQLGFTKNS